MTTQPAENWHPANYPGMGIFEFDFDAGLATLKHTHAHLLGHEPHQYQAAYAVIRRYIHPEDRSGLDHLYRELLSAARDSFQITFRQRSKAGSWVWLLAVGRVIKRDAQYRPLRLLGTYTECSGHMEVLPNEPLQLQTMLTKVVNVAPVALHEFRLETDGRTSMPYATPDIEEIYGLTPEELARDFSQANRLIHPDDRERIKAAITESAHTLKPFHHEWRIRHPRKGEIWVECHSMPEQTVEGSTVWYGYFLDITKRKRAEKDHALWSFAMAHISEAAYLIDDRARFLYVNDKACQSLGYGRDELLRMGIMDIDPDYSIELWKRHWHEIKNKGSIILETVHRNRAGEEFPVEVRANYFEYEGYGYNLALVHDITERKQSEGHLALLSFALNHVRESAYLIDQQSRFLYVNDEACRQLGYSREELLQLGVVNIDPDFPMEHWQEHWNDIRTNGSVTIETSHQRKDGTLFPIEVSANYFEYDGQGFNLALVRDISERRRQEIRERMRTAVLEKLIQGATLQEILKTIAHGIEEENKEVLCSILLLDEEGKHLILGAAPSLPDFYNKALQGIAIGPGAGSCGVAAWTGQRVIVGDIRTHPDWIEYRELAMRAGLAACWSEPICDREGRVLGTFAIYHRTPATPSDKDIDLIGSSANLAGVAIEHRHAEAALLESEERFRQMASNIQEVFWLTDVKNRQILYVSPAYEEIFGRPCEELHADPSQWAGAIHPEDRQRVQRAMINLQSAKDYNLEYRIIRPDGTLRYIQDRAFPIHDAAGSVYRIAGLAQDITARKEQETRIEYLAYHDALTELPNRALTMDRLEYAITRAQRHDQTLGVLFIDLDRFKTINDTLGHPAGDALLQQVGERLSSTLRKQDTVGRVGGDEFLVLLLELRDAEDAAHVAEKILAALSIPFTVDGHELHISASVGISLYPRDGVRAAPLVQYADTALYLAKEEGRDTFRFFSPELDARIHDRLHLENDLRRAIEKDELLLHYQPLMDLATGKVTGLEVLVRWQHPTKGLIPPGDFIPIAEDIGLISAIGEWALHTAAVQARIWQVAGFSGIRLCVNLSPRQLAHSDFADKVHAIIRETGYEAHLLEFEITESSAMSNPEETIAKLQALHEMGIRLSLDDFGTGYSSLAYLKRFPLDRLKIDASFIAGIPDDSNDMAIVQTIIVLARQLGLTVVAEGVETTAQKTFLRENGCNEMQGYLLSRPLPIHELEKQFGFPVTSG